MRPLSIGAQTEVAMPELDSHLPQLAQRLRSCTTLHAAAAATTAALGYQNPRLPSPRLPSPRLPSLRLPSLRLPKPALIKTTLGRTLQSKKGNPDGLPFLLSSGAGDRSRTYDLRITNALLYQLSYTGETLNLRNLLYRSTDFCVAACELIESDRARNTISDFELCEAPCAVFFRKPASAVVAQASSPVASDECDRRKHRTSGVRVAGK